MRSRRSRTVLKQLVLLLLRLRGFFAPNSAFRLPHSSVRFVGTAIAFVPAQIRPGDGALLLADLRRACRGRRPGRRARRRGAEVEQLVGAGDHFLVVLDHQQRVAEVAKFVERLDQAQVVARMQADRRFVEHVQHAGEAAADLARQANALRLAAGERRRRAAEREVFEADVDEELQAVADFAPQLAGDLLVASSRA